MPADLWRDVRTRADADGINIRDVIVCCLRAYVAGDIRPSVEVMYKTVNADFWDVSTWTADGERRPVSSERFLTRAEADAHALNERALRTVEGNGYTVSVTPGFFAD